MTESQFNYLTDLAADKGIVLEDTENKSAAWASAKIEELKKMPDAVFAPVTEEQDAKINALINYAREELKRWTFTR